MKMYCNQNCCVFVFIEFKFINKFVRCMLMYILFIWNKYAQLQNVITFETFLWIFLVRDTCKGTWHSFFVQTAPNPWIKYYIGPFCTGGKLSAIISGSRCVSFQHFCQVLVHENHQFRSKECEKQMGAFEYILITKNELESTEYLFFT